MIAMASVMEPGLCARSTGAPHISSGSPLEVIAAIEFAAPTAETREDNQRVWNSQGSQKSNKQHGAYEAGNFGFGYHPQDHQQYVDPYSRFTKSPRSNLRKIREKPDHQSNTNAPYVTKQLPVAVLETKRMLAIKKRQQHVENTQVWHSRGATDSHLPPDSQNKAYEMGELGYGYHLQKYQQYVDPYSHFQLDKGLKKHPVVVVEQ